MKLDKVLDGMIVLGSVAALLCGAGVVRESVRAGEAVERAEYAIRVSRAAAQDYATPVIMVLDDASDGEDVDEDGAIDRALVKAGYFSEDIPLSLELQDELRTACDLYGVTYHLALGLIEVESGFQPWAENGDCYGLCQLNRAYFPDGLTPAENVRAGMEYLGRLLEEYHGDVEAALTAYNAGHDTGRREYAERVLEAAGRFAGGLS